MLDLIGFWDMTLLHQEIIFRRSKDRITSILKGLGFWEEPLKVKAVCTLEMWGTDYPAKQQHNPEERNPQTNGCGKLKAFLYVDIW